MLEVMIACKWEIIFNNLAFMDTGSCYFEEMWCEGLGFFDDDNLFRFFVGVSRPP
jgi:hypothetical protein